LSLTTKYNLSEAFKATTSPLPPKFKCTDLDFTTSTAISFSHYSVCQKNNKVSFYMDGNASEWLNEQDAFIGSNWRDSSHFYSDSVRISKQPTDFISFRCIAEIKTWKFD